MENQTEKFETWAILELMGHRRLAGKVSEATIGGGAFLRIDIPCKKSQESTQFYSPASIYCITPTTEEIARATAEHNQPEPVHRWEFPQLIQANPLSDPYESEDSKDEPEYQHEPEIDFFDNDCK